MHSAAGQIKVNELKKINKKAEKEKEMNCNGHFSWTTDWMTMLRNFWPHHWGSALMASGGIRS